MAFSNFHSRHVKTKYESKSSRVRSIEKEGVWTVSNGKHWNLISGDDDTIKNNGAKNWRPTPETMETKTAQRFGMRVFMSVSLRFFANSDALRAKK